MSAQRSPTVGYPKKSEQARAICLPRWEGWVDGKQGQADPCDACPLYRPCIRGKDACAPGLEAFTRWINGINELADSLAKAGAA